MLILRNILAIGAVFEITIEFCLKQALEVYLDSWIIGDSIWYHHLISPFDISIDE